MRKTFNTHKTSKNKTLKVHKFTMKQFAFLFAVVFLLGCAAVQEQKSGFLQGHISIGPLCPVERNPPDPNCLPTAQTYKAYPIGVYKINYVGGVVGEREEKISEFYGDKDGNYSIELPAGEYKYLLKQETGMSSPRYISPNGSSQLRITIRADEITRVDIDIDTGIR